MPIARITADDVNKFIELYRSGLTQIKAAAEVGYRLETIRSAATRLGIPWPKRKGIRDAVLERFDEIQRSSKTQKEWAQEFDVSQCRIATLFKELGLKSKFGGQHKGRQADHFKKFDECRQIISFITANGGYIPDAIAALGLKTPPQFVRDYARTIGFDLSHWQFSNQRYGNWLTIPGPWVRKPPNNYLVPAVCLSCGEIFQINLQNARTGKTNSCLTCSNRQRSNNKVLNVTTGQEYPSVLSWAKSIGQYSNYQKLRILLKRAGSVDIDGIIYQLVS